ncbi:sigma-54 dependent transcriptional regulator [Mannheimia sp. AT1]|uniref:Sigma-54 dependent transcriptional regulator n=1 Tax=Mannheimia cairinae TaxID=3025936 RepID=A0ABT5MRA6_9PAST|nr:sigma-54 dependent transcriptional regulator [Mannheimia cairinae]MDD0823373.1 sigma-54 dependent transcriptional regulator [Mannheimia cairinae]MDD0827019.1 sigma-54 dependent transcriptional regulator [Mannheimia cairinae]
MNNKVLLIDDDQDVLQAYQALLELEGYQTICVSNPLSALTYIEEDWQGIVVSDIYMPQMSGWELLEQIHQKDKHLPVILITGHGDVPMAIEAMKKGAFYFIEKPVKPEQLLQQVEQASQQRQTQLATKLWQQTELETHFIGNSHWIKTQRKRLQQLAETNLPVLIFGEIGTGRTLSANYLYELAKPRFDSRYYLELLDTEDSKKLQEQLPSLTNAVIILKNIEYLSILVQKALVQFIQQHSQCRVIAISQYSSQQLLSEYGLLPELFYSFTLTQLECIPLSHRPADIEPLFRHYLSVMCQKLQKKKPAVTDSFIKQLLSQQWLGNITQLIHTAELYAVGVTVQKEHFNFTQQEQGELSLDLLIEEYEKSLIIDVLERFQGRINDVAEYLKIPRKKLYLRMKKYDLNKESFKD